MKMRKHAEMLLYGRLSVFKRDACIALEHLEVNPGTDNLFGEPF
jgi:hypothetical protein